MQPEANIKPHVGKTNANKSNDGINAVPYWRLNQSGPHLDEARSFCFFKWKVRIIGRRAINLSVFSAIKHKP